LKREEIAALRASEEEIQKIRTVAFNELTHSETEKLKLIELDDIKEAARKKLEREEADTLRSDTMHLSAVRLRYRSYVLILLYVLTIEFVKGSKRD